MDVLTLTSKYPLYSRAYSLSPHYSDFEIPLPPSVHKSAHLRRATAMGPNHSARQTSSNWMSQKKKRREGIRGGTIAERSMTRRLRWRCSHLGASNLPSTYTYCLLESSILYISSDFNYYILFIVTRHLVLPRRVDSSLDKFQKLRKERKRFSANEMKHGWESSTLGSSRGGAKNVDNLDKSS